MSSTAIYDVLRISHEMKNTVGAIAATEIHLFAYLSCLLGLYRSVPVSDWGYEFVGAVNGTPFSKEIDEAIDDTYRKGWVTDNEKRFYELTDEGEKELSGLCELEQLSIRDEYLIGACTSLDSLPIGVVRTAISSEHDINLAHELGHARELLSESSVDELHDAFKVLSDQIGIEVVDLSIPAVVWLTYLSKVATSAKEENQE